MVTAGALTGRTVGVCSMHVVYIIAHHLPTPTLSSLIFPSRNSETGIPTKAYCSPRRASGKGVGVLAWEKGGVGGGKEVNERGDALSLTPVDRSPS